MKKNLKKHFQLTLPTDKKTIKTVLFVLILISTVLILSYLRWKRDYLVNPLEYCPDQYCEYTEAFYNFFKNRTYKDFLNLKEFYEKRYIASSPLAPLLSASLNLLLGNVLTSYMIVSFISSIGTILIFNKIIYKDLQVKDKNIYIFISLLMFHIIFIRSFARPLTDSIGLLCTSLTLFFVYDISEKFNYRKLFYYSLFIFFALFSRVSLLPIVGFIILHFFIKFVQEKRLNYLESAFNLGFLTILLFIIVASAFGFLHTIPKAFEVAHHPKFLLSYNKSDLAKILIVSLQIYPLFWFLGIIWKKFLRREEERLHFLWIIYYILFLIIAKGALWNRYLLPIVPSIILISVNPLRELKKKNFILFVVAILITILFNLIPILIQIVNPTDSSLFSSIIRFFH